jgi:hypothetical protein
MTEQDFEDHLRRLVIDLCEVLYQSGVTQVPIDSLMRCIGVPQEAAALHEGEFFALDGEDFQKSLARRRGEKITRRPPGTSLH